MLLYRILLVLCTAVVSSPDPEVQALLKNRCDVSSTVKYETDCTSCAASYGMLCPKGSFRKTSGMGNKGCSYTVDTGGATLSIGGCSHTCQTAVTERKCCKGFWGNTCSACPGGSTKPCSGHGTCMDGINGNGTCVCDEGFSGLMCKECADEYLYGSNCASACECKHGICKSGYSGDGSCICEAGYTGPKCDEESLPCKALNCGANARCIEPSPGKFVCGCMPGYKMEHNICEPLSACRDAPCSPFAICKSTGPRQYKCTCKPGYYGDGKTCFPINPCNVNNGGCVEHSTQCVYLSPGKSSCSCKSGMTTRNISAGCSFPSRCLPSSCGKSAHCEMSPMGVPKCLCLDEEISDGRNCYGNILQQIRKQNTDGMFIRKLSGAVKLFEMGCSLILRKYGPFTVFVPAVKVLNIDHIMAEEQCNNHIIPGLYMERGLPEKLWTLSGYQIDTSKHVFTIQSRPGVTYKFIKMDIPASNGIIHIIDKVIANVKQTTIGSPQMTIGEILSKTEQFSRYETMLENCDLPPILNGFGRFTVFVPTNEAVDSLRDGRLIYLFTEAKHKLLQLVKNHIFTPAMITAGGLITMSQIVTSAYEAISINFTENGKITIGDSGATLQRTNIIASNGIIHVLDGVLIPSGILPILPHRCNETRYEIINGTCSSCDSISPCPDSSIDLGTTEKGCTFIESGNSVPGCARHCQQTITELGCCRGFFGPECRPCPGGFTDPCYGRGTCNDGLRGNGKCKCFEKYKGMACHICTDPNKHGDECEEDCMCVHGVCDNRPGSKGVCQGYRCKTGYTGPFCDQWAEPCGPLNLTQNCHLNAVCEVSENITRCVCSNGYEGNGYSCRPVDLCKKPDRGGCSENAICTNNSPGNVTCQCNPGWTGDGLACLPINNCLLEDRGGCHMNADCNYVQPGESACTCKKGYAGDGYLCDLVDPCLENNGGCHELAQCKPTTGGDRTCACPEGFAGDGLTCYGDVLMELTSNPDLTIFTQWLKSAHFTIPTGANVTALVPSDVVIKAFPEGQKLFWLDQYRLPFLVRAHFLQGSFTSAQLMQYDGKEVSTLDPRTKWDVETVNGSVTINNASAVITDIPSVNGYIFIINKILIPPLGSIPPARPNLTQLLQQVPVFDKFKQALQDTGLIEEIEASEQKYTIFVPVNSAMVKHYNDSGTEQMDNNTMQYHIIQGEKLSPTDLRNGIHKESMLGISYWLMFYQKENKTFVNDAPLAGNMYETNNGILIGISKVLEFQRNRCDISALNQSPAGNKTKCGPCRKFVLCPSGTALEKESCKYRRRGKELSGCKFKCISTSLIRQCCQGYYGHQCLSCPGGPGNLCSNNGNCQDGIDGNGDCICKEGFHGTACETCEPGRYGNDCKSECLCFHGKCNDGLLGDGTCQCEKGWSGYTCERDIKNDLCNDTCSIYANCIAGPTNSTPTCSCIAGYTGNGTHCTEINACLIRNGGCSDYATCRSVAKGLRVCSCIEGYTGDGVICIEMDSCLENNGGCHINAECIKTGPNKVACNCLPGYQGDGVNTCASLNLCLKDNGGCSQYARCTFTEPRERTCMCLEGYVGDGITCTGSISQELSYNPDTVLFHKMLQDQDVKDLSGSGPFTVFVPEPAALLNSTAIEEWKSRNLIKDLLRYHFVGCQMLLANDFADLPSVTTISGGILRFSSKEDGIYLNGEAKITRSDHIARNGVIHFISKVLIPEIERNLTISNQPSKLKVTEAAEMFGYSMFSKFLKESNLLSLVNDKIYQPFTMLWPTDRAFNAMPEERMTWFKQEDILAAHLRGHMIRSTALHAANLPNAQFLRTMHGSSVSFTCSQTSLGDIMVNENNARIVQRHMEFNSGIAYGIDQLLEPPNLGARCDRHVTQEDDPLSVPCNVCGQETRKCPAESIDSGSTRLCIMRRLSFIRPSLYSKPLQSQSLLHTMTRRSKLGCRKICKSVMWVPECCKNHYGRDCQVCSGGLEAPCGNHGTCDDGISGSGACLCSSHFNGTACELCSPGRFGSSCQACNCTENGKCNDGISGDGSCFCNAGWAGDNCELKLDVKPVCSPVCDGNATCRANNTCECNPFYDGDGWTCTVIDRCGEQNGGCSSHANCTQLGVDISCRCFPDYDGDGHICNPIDLCANGLNGGCSEHATCINIGANVRRCECHNGYVGNGVQCLETAIPPVDRCLEANGDCHSEAECADLHYQEKTAGVFHLQSPKGKYQFTYQEAENACAAEGASIATFSQLSAAQQMGFHLCVVGWLYNRTAGYPTTYPNPSCGSNHVGIVDYKQRTNISELYDVYCFRVQDVRCTCNDGYVGDGYFCNGNLLDVLGASSQFSVYYTMLLDYANATEKGAEFLDYLSNITSYKTLFVPTDESFDKNVTLSWRDLEHHVSQVDVLLAYDNLTNGTVLPSKTGYNLSIFHYADCTESSCTKAVNNRIIVVWDIPASNGIIHVINGSLVAPLVSQTRSPMNPPVTLGVAGALVVLFIGFVLGAGFFYFRQQNKGFQFRHFQAEVEEEDTYIGEHVTPTLVSVPNPVYGANNVFFDPFEDSFDEDVAQKILR